MNRTEKIEAVATLERDLAKSQNAILFGFAGLKVTEVTELRRQVRATKSKYLVVKNTLARRAAEAAGFPQLQDEIKGPVAIAFGYDDLGIPSRLINEWVRATRLKLEVVGGLVEGRVFSPNEIKQLADLPSRETLIAQLMGTLQSPVAQLLGIMQTPLQQLMGTLNAYKTKLEAA